MNLKIVDESDEKYKRILENNYQSNLAPSPIALRLVKRGSKVLSAGCGRGREARFISRELGCNVTAIDISKENVEKSRGGENND